MSAATFFVGASLGLVFLSSMFPAAAVPLVAAALTVPYAARVWIRRPAPAARAVGVVGWAVTVAAYALFAYLGFAWGRMLLWTVPVWGWAAVLAFAFAAALTAWRPWRGIRVAPALALGAWIALCLLGWRVEERQVRCDDAIALAEQPGVALVAPTSRRIESCAAGETRSIGRYPRVVWQAPEGPRLVVTTQRANGADETDDRFDGSVCDVRPGAEPVCVGEGKAQGLSESPSLDRLFVASWGRMAPGVRGQLLAVPRSGDFELAGVVDTEGSLGELFYDPSADRIYGFTDEGFELLRFEASTLERLPPEPIPLFPPGAIRYDGGANEGLICSAGGPIASLDGERFISVAVRGDPFELRPLGADSVLSALTMTWGCDWDPERRAAYVAVPNLGLLVTLDYDSGAVRRVDYVGFGMRSVTVDAARDRLYLTDFLGGRVVAVDRESGAEVARWAVGRFPRFTTLSRDGGSLLVGTNLGVVSIELEPVT